MNSFTQYPLTDLNAAITACGSEEMAKEIFTMLQTSLSEHETEITEAFNAKDLDKLSRAAHKLHGAACYTGTPRLKEAAKALEIAAKHQSAVEPAYEQLCDVMKATQTASL